MGKYIYGGILIIIGLSGLTGVPLIHYIFPIILIMIGWAMISGNRWSQRWKESVPFEASDINEVLVFTGTRKTLGSTNFKGGKIAVVFGGAEIDMSKVKTTEKVVRLELVAVLGGIQLRVPQNWHIVSEAVSVLGGISNRTMSKEDGKVELHIKGAAVLGGIDILN